MCNTYIVSQNTSQYYVIIGIQSCCALNCFMKDADNDKYLKVFKNKTEQKT